MKYVALDIGNVLCEVQFEPFLKDLSYELNITLEDAKYFLNRCQKQHDLGITLMRDELHDHFKINSPVIIDKLLKSWNRCVYPKIDVLDMYNKLIQSHNLQVALLSNIGIEHAAQIKDLLEYNGFVSNAITHFSCDVGARKPTALFYQSFLIMYPEFKGCVYVDDIPANLEVGEKFGFQPYLFALSDPDWKKDLEEIEKLILSSGENA